MHVTLHARGNMNLDEDVWYVGGLPSAHDLKELGKSTTLPVALCNIQRDDCGLFTIAGAEFYLGEAVRSKHKITREYLPGLMMRWSDLRMNHTLPVWHQRGIPNM